MQLEIISIYLQSNYNKLILNMNKALFEKVKALSKDTGLSEKYLKAITEKIGGSIEDDSTDEKAIEETANQIADIAKESQGEATRWANKKREESKQEEEERKKKEEEERKNNETSNQNDERIKKLEKELEEMRAEREKGKRVKEIAAAMEKHKIPTKFRERLAKSIADDEDIEEAVANIKQDFITDGLMTDGSEGDKVASEKQVDEAADDLLKSITVK